MSMLLCCYDNGSCTTESITLKEEKNNNRNGKGCLRGEELENKQRTEPRGYQVLGQLEIL